MTTKAPSVKSLLLRAMVAMTLTGVLSVAPARAWAQQEPYVNSPAFNMSADPPSAHVGDPVTFTITRTNFRPADLVDDSVRDFLPWGAQFVSANPSQGECALYGRADLGEPYNPTNGYDSDVVECALGNIPPGESATVDVTVVPTAAGEMKNIAVERVLPSSELEANATVTVEE